jgi:hypothetical protein
MLVPELVRFVFAEPNEPIVPLPRLPETVLVVAVERAAACDADQKRLERQIHRIPDMVERLVLLEVRPAVIVRGLLSRGGHSRRNHGTHRPHRHYVAAGNCPHRR